MSGANDKTGVGSGSGEWQTPPGLFARLHRKFAFDFDAFASDENALCDDYATATHIMSGGIRHEGQDAFSGTWSDRRVFCNPPYSRGFIKRTVVRMAEQRHNAHIIVALLPAATDTQWFHDVLVPNADITFLPKRVRFINPATGKPGDSPPGGHLIAVFKTDYLDDQ